MQPANPRRWGYTLHMYPPTTTLILLALATLGMNACARSNSEGPDRGRSTERNSEPCVGIHAQENDGAGHRLSWSPSASEGLHHKSGYTLRGTLRRADSSDPSQPVDLTLLRYAPQGEHMVVTDYLNLALGEEDAFEAADLPEGLWVAAARSASVARSSWGRSQPTWLGPEAASAEVEIKLRAYRVDVIVQGVPDELADHVSITFDWTPTDRTTKDALEFLDPPLHSGHGGLQRDGFQVFGSLMEVPPGWLAFDENASPPLDDDGLPIFRTTIDPYGIDAVNWSWVTTCPLGHATISVGGPGQVTATLQAAPGLWPSQAVTLDLDHEMPSTERVFEVSVEAISERVALGSMPGDTK